LINYCIDKLLYKILSLFITAWEPQFPLYWKG